MDPVHPSSPNPREEPEETKVEAVVQPTDVKRRKKPLGTKIKDTFFGGAATGVWGYILAEVVVPMVKDLISDVVQQATDRTLYGESRGPSSRRTTRPGTSFVSYNRMGNNSALARPEPRQPEISRRGRATHSFDEIILSSRPQADRVLDGLYEQLSRYDQVTVATLYELVGISAEFTDHRYGWTSLNGSNIRRVREGFLLDLPTPEPLRG